MNWENHDTYFKKTRFHFSTVKEGEDFLNLELKSTNLKSSIPYDDANERNFVSRRNLSKKFLYFKAVC